CLLAGCNAVSVFNVLEKRGALFYAVTCSSHHLRSPKITILASSDSLTWCLHRHTNHIVGFSTDHRHGNGEHLQCCSDRVSVYVCICICMCLCMSLCVCVCV